MRLFLRFAMLALLLWVQPALAQDNGLIQATISQILNSPDRLSLPIEKIRPALKAHYVTGRGQSIGSAAAIWTSFWRG